eukprot:Seg3945.3 transcript_id=Seg3945.3/GoldUCD/mRNA.D3Y31 product="ARL14 effector protein" protein_id=Seg3945.3/GoldUCD/D3Y31
MDECTVGEKMGTECHRTSYTPKTGFADLNELDQTQKQLLELRSGIKGGIQTLCCHHKQCLLHKYEEYQRTCCNPFSLHRPNKKGSLRMIPMDQLPRARCLNIQLVPGKKLCPGCRGKLYTDRKECEDKLEERMHFEEPQDVDSEDEDIMFVQKSISIEEDRSDLSSLFESIGESPIKVHSLPESSKVKKGK